MRIKKMPSALALACLGLCGVLPAHAAADSVDTDKVVVNGTPIEATFDSKGSLWVSARGDSGWGIKQVNLATKQIRTYPDSTIHAEGMVEGADGNMWFASRAGSGQIGRIADGNVSYFTPPPGYGRPWHIAAGADGALWFTMSEYEDIPGVLGAIGRITPAGVITVYPLGQTRNVTKIAAGPDGALWATAPNTNEIVRISTQGVVSYFPAKVDIGDNAGIVTGPDGNLWYTTGTPRHGQATGVVRMDRNGNVLRIFSGENIASPMAIVAGKDGNVWFSNGVGSSTIGRIKMDGQVDAFVLPSGRLPLQWGMAHNLITGDLWTVEPSSGALERYPTQGYVLRLAMTGNRGLDETADATGNYAPVAGLKGDFAIASLAGWPNNYANIEAWSFHAQSPFTANASHPSYRWHLRATEQATSFALMNVRSNYCVQAGSPSNEQPCAVSSRQAWIAESTPVARQYALRNPESRSCAHFTYGYNYAIAHPKGEFFGGHYRFGGSTIGIEGRCLKHYNQRISFE